MDAFCVALPLLPGKDEECRRFCRAVSARYASEWADGETRVGIVRESWFLQRTSLGDFLIVYFEADDVARAADEFARSKHPFDLWVKEQLESLTGLDPNVPRVEHPEAMLAYGYRIPVPTALGSRPQA